MTGAPASGADTWAIDLRHVEKTYNKKIRALRGIDMRVRSGEIFGLLGPNGAGKSTLVKILMTVIRATRAEGQVLGQPVGDKETLSRVGYLPEHHRFPDYLTGEQVVDHAAALAGVARRERRSRRGELLELVGMARWATTPVGKYSKGMRQRIGIAQALANDPLLVLLDEPTDGVDPVGRRDIRDMLLRLRAQGKTVLVNSHLLSELELVCDRVAILVQGTVRSQGTIDDLTTHRRAFEVELGDAGGTLLQGPALARTAEEAGLLQMGAVAEAALLRVRGQDASAVQPLIDRVRGAGLVLRALRPVRPSLEDLFMEAVTDPSTGRELLPGAGEGSDARARPAEGVGASTQNGQGVRS